MIALTEEERKKTKLEATHFIVGDEDLADAEIRTMRLQAQAEMCLSVSIHSGILLLCPSSFRCLYGFAMTSAYTRMPSRAGTCCFRCRMRSQARGLVRVSLLMLKSACNFPDKFVVLQLRMLLALSIRPRIRNCSSWKQCRQAKVWAAPSLQRHSGTFGARGGLRRSVRGLLLTLHISRSRL